MRHSPLGPVLNWLTARADEFPPVAVASARCRVRSAFTFDFAPQIDTRKWVRSNNQPGGSAFSYQC